MVRRLFYSSSALLLLCALLSQQLVEARHRYNSQDEPLFADDEGSDVHTVTLAASRRPTSAQVQPSRVSPAAASNAVTSSFQLPPIATESQQKPARGLPQLASAVALTVGPKKSASTAKRQISAPVSRVYSDDPPISQRRIADPNEQPTGHWSALQNYYDQLARAGARAGSRARQPASSSGDYYPEQQVQDSRDFQTAQPPPQYFPIGTTDAGSVKSPVLTQSSPWTLPTYSISNPQQLPPTRPQQQQQQPQLQQQQQQTSYELPRCRLDSGDTLARYEPIVQQPISLDWSTDFGSNLLDKTFYEQEQFRARHQQQTFGSLVNGNYQEQLRQEEMGCGPRNMVRNLVAAGRRRQSQPFLGFGEYPSHMGLYNGSEPNDENFLCSATLIHSRFAVTLASCLVNLTTPVTPQTARQQRELILQTGDWNINRRSLSEVDRQAVMMVRQVARVHLFPRYQGGEHNLALLEWAKPIEFPVSEYISPACQAPNSRSSFRTRTCWAPIRNITVELVFDPNGDGETKAKQNVQMVEIPINLITNDDFECRKQTLIESFNFLHPNYICSSDFKQTQWRARLKQSQYLGSGVYCEEGGFMSLVSLMHPIQSNTTALDFGYLDLSYYRPWMRDTILASTTNSAGLAGR